MYKNNENVKKKYENVCERMKTDKNVRKRMKTYEKV